MKTIFGPAGVPINQKDNINGINYSSSVGLKAYELEFVRGVKMSELLMSLIKKTAEKNSIKLSCHAPYWTNCCNNEKYVTNKSNIIQTINAAVKTGASIIVIHPGYYSELSPEQAFNNFINTINKIIIEADKKGYKDYLIGVETSGKRTQFGGVDEIINICKEIKRCRPVIDFAHVHARSGGVLRTENDFQKIFDSIEKELGKHYLKDLHCHFAEIEYTEKGERYHLAIGARWEPDFRKLAKVIADNDYELRIISESPLLDEDALKMKSLLEHEYKVRLKQL